MKKHTVLKTVGGLSVGFVNALLGAGGGMLAVPILASSGLTQKSAHANSVAVIMPLSLVSAWMYLGAGSVSVRDVLPFLPMGLIGAAVGTLLLRKLSDKQLKRIFALFMIWAGVRLMLK